MLKIWNGSQVKTKAPVIKNNVFIKFGLSDDIVMVTYW